jgi:hypothetical protein
MNATSKRKRVCPQAVIHPRAIYYLADLSRLFGFRASTVRTARRSSGLRVGRRAGRVFVMGSWLLEWFQSGELPPNGIPRNGAGG